MTSDRHWWRLCLALCAVFVASVALSGPLDARLTFSLDGGKSWSEDFPAVASGSVVRVRAAYTIVDNWERRDVICADIHASEPFASHTRKLKQGDYMQRHPKNWKSSQRPGDYVWDLDTGGMSPGTHVFMLEIGYWRQNDQGKICERITDNQPFYIKVRSRKQQKRRESNGTGQT